MAKYIPLDALVAEIERLIKLFTIPQYQCEYNDAKADGFREFLSFIDTLEVKEVDLEEEIKEEYLKRRCYGGRDNMLVILNEPEFNTIAKHFFELGLKARKGE